MYVELKNINKNYGDYKASDDVNFGIERGKLVALLGPSGSGKTTILRMLAGLEYPDSGDIYIDGKRMNQVPASKRGIGFVFQNYEHGGHAQHHAPHAEAAAVNEKDSYSQHCQHR